MKNIDQFRLPHNENFVTSVKQCDNIIKWHDMNETRYLRVFDAADYDL